MLAGKCAQGGWDVDHLLIAKIEGCVRAVSDWELGLLCKVLGVFPDELMGFRPLPARSTDVSEYEFNEEPKKPKRRAKT